MLLAAFVACIACRYAGLIAHSAGAIYAERTVVQNSTATGFGGCGAGWGGGWLEMSDSKCLHNTGGVHIGCLGYVFGNGKLSNVEMRGCSGGSIAGALCAYGAVLDVDNCDISNSYAGTEGGGMCVATRSLDPSGHLTGRTRQAWAVAAPCVPVQIPAPWAAPCVPVQIHLARVGRHRLRSTTSG